MAKNNQPGGVANIEGIVPTTDSQFGGNFDNDNSGILRYVRVEFAGIALEPNKEVNGITFGSVGSGTVVDYVQVTLSGDDSFEWFGGTVNCKHLIAYRGLDDDFDCDFGYRGKVQFALSIRDKDLYDAPGDSNSFECDNDAAGSTAQPKTRPVFSNVTLVGAKGNGTTALPAGEKFEKAFRLRRNSAVSVLNSLVTGWEKGISIEGAPVVANLNGDTMVFVNNILTNFAQPAWTTNNTNTVLNSGGSTTSWYNSWFGVDGNDSTQTLAQVNWVNLFTALGVTPDARLAAGSSAATGATFMNGVFYSVATPVVATNSFTYCQGATATALTANALIGNSLRWYTQPTGGTFTTTAPVPSTTTAGTYTYYVSQANVGNDESMRAAITVVVNALPATPTITASGSTTFCTGGSVDLTSSAATGNTWSTNATTTTITVSTTGNYTVTVTDANGCVSASTPISVNVSNAPTPTISASSTQACSGDVVTVTASAADSYSWSTGETTQSIQVSNTASVFVTVTNANACNGVGQSATTNITFTATPTAAGSFTTAGNIVTFTNTSTGAASYSWDFGDFTNSSATAPAHAYAANGAYTVTLTAINGNCSSTATFEISIEVGMEEASALNFTVYPNPASAQVLVAFDNTSEGSIQILDAMGRTIYTEKLTAIGSIALPVDVSQLADGTYTIQVINANQVGIKRLVIRN